MEDLKGSVLQKEEQQDFIIPDYTEEEQVYVKNIQKRLESARDKREAPHPEFDGLSFTEYWNANERGANTIIKSSTKDENEFQTGTLRTKMMAFLTSYLALNLRPDISAFDENDILVARLGEAIEDVNEKTEELEGDEEKRMLRQYEMLKHGYVFDEDLWDEKFAIEKILTSGFWGKIEGVKWDTKKVKLSGSPRREIVSGLSVFLGDLTKYCIEDQPYVFTVETMEYDEAEKIYGEWERWKYVSKTKRPFSSASDQAMVQNAWRLSDTNDGKVEVIKYQDKPNNEFQIILNGVLMLPMGYPLSDISSGNEYTIVQQNLEPIRHNFSYGKSFVFKNKNLVAVLDQMTKWAVLKTKKSFLPPRLNLSDRVISKNMFMPGVVTRGIQPGQVPPIDEKEAQGVSPSEFAMIQEVIRFIDKNTVSQTFTGAREQGGRVTATQIIELQKQARMMMGLVELAAILLEKKLATKRMMIILEKWFHPIGEKIGEARNLLKRYRVVSVEESIEDKGVGLRMTIPTDKMLSPEEIRRRENEMERTIGRPIRITLINVKQIKKAKLTWVITVNPREKRSSEMAKVLFSEMISQAVALQLPLRPSFVKEKFAEVWGLDTNKVFLSEGEIQPIQQVQQETETPVEPITQTTR